MQVPSVAAVDKHSSASGEIGWASCALFGAAGLAKSTKNNETETRRSHHESPEARHRVAAGKRPYRKPRLAEPDLMWKRLETAANPSDTGRQARMLVGHGMATMASHRRHELCAFAWRETVDETIVLNNVVSRFAGRAAVLVVFSRYG